MNDYYAYQVPYAQIVKTLNNPFTINYHYTAPLIQNNGTTRSHVKSWLSYYFNHENPIQKLNFEPIISMIKLTMMSNFQESCGLTS